jgi:pilus assembly protein CpaC
MAFLLWLLLVLPSSASALPHEIQLEVGEDYLIKPQELLKIEKVWIEEKNVLSASLKDRGLVIKSLQTGQSHVRIGKQLKLFRVTPPGSRRQFDIWQEVARSKFKGLSVNYCGLNLCAYGLLEKLEDYLTILKLARENSAPLLMAADITEAAKKEVSAHVAKVLRENGLTPQKLVFSKPWRSFYKASTPDEQAKKVLQYLGVDYIYRETATQLADNVEVTVQIAELSKSFLQKYGITWPSQYQAQLVDFKNLQGSPGIDLALNAAEASGEAKILASPKLICRSGKEADFFAGGEFPVKVQNLRTSHLEWKRYGIGLKLKPQLDAVGQLNLQIETEISSVDQALKIDDMPAVHLTRVSTFFDLINNKTIALSGLLRNETSQNAEGLPFLKNLPVLGSLFSSRNYIEHKSEMIVFVTPRLISTESE